MRHATILAMLMFPGLALGQSQREPLIAYWLNDVSPETATMYDPLLVITCVPLQQLSENARRHDVRNPLVARQNTLSYILDQPALFLETNARDSIWNQDGRPIKPFSGKLTQEKNSRTMSAFGRQYRVTSAAIADVTRLLRKPEGTKKLHRLFPPLLGAERTAYAIALLLEDQAEPSLEESSLRP